MSESTVDSEVTTAQLKTMLEEGDPALTALNARWVDALVRESRTRGWCEDFDIFMARYASAWMTMEREPEDTNRYRLYDTDGYNCRGYDRDGYNAQGYDRRGYDRRGYNRDGYNNNGYNVDGFNRDGYDAEGADVDGFNRQGRLVNHTRGGYANRFRFDASGYDREGFNGNGTIRSYSTRQSLAALRLLPDSAYVYDRDGYTRQQREVGGALTDEGGAVRGCTCDECTEARRGMARGE